tara:strand:+ start:1559 stop:1816 length:258 start_codon:yes stop_codon:yes gene_type:complete
MASEYKLFWTEEAIINLEDIIDYLHYKWTIIEVNRFKKKLDHLLHLIHLNPNLFPPSIEISSARKSVLTKQISVFYKIENQHIFI